MTNLSHTRTLAEVWQDTLSGLRALPITFPLALRSLRRRPLRAALAAVTIAAALIGFMTFSAYIEGRAGALASRVASLRLPSDAVITGDQPFTAAALRAADRSAAVDAFEAGRVDQCYAQIGRLQVLRLPAGGRVLGALDLIAGRLPANADEILLSEPVARLTEATVGDLWTLAAAGIDPDHRASADTDAGAAPPTQVRIVGVYRPTDDWLEQPVMITQPDTPLNVAFAWLTRDRNDPTTANTIARILGGTALHGGTPRANARALLTAIYAPGYGIALALFAFVSLGLLSVLLLSFIQRKRQFGIMKAIGLANPELQFLLLGEGGVIAAAGALFGVPAGVVLIHQLEQRAGMTLTLRPGAVIGAVILAIGVFYLGSLIPATISRQAPVDALLFNRRVYLNGNPSCARCGRCGGF